MFGEHGERGSGRQSAVLGVSNGERLTAESIEYDPKRVPATVPASECVVGRQDGFGIAAGEVHRPGIAGGKITVYVSQGNGQGKGVAGHGAGRGGQRQGCRGG